jgi:hypothetical protein
MSISFTTMTLPQTTLKRYSLLITLTKRRLKTTEVSEMDDKFAEAMNESVLTRESLKRIEDSLANMEAMIKTFQDFILEVSPADAKKQIQELENELGN